MASASAVGVPFRVVSFDWTSNCCDLNCAISLQKFWLVLMEFGGLSVIFDYVWGIRVFNSGGSGFGAVNSLHCSGLKCAYFMCNIRFDGEFIIEISFGY